MNVKYIIAGLKYRFSRIWTTLFVMPINGLRWQAWHNKPFVHSSIDSLKMLVDRKCSICRFGDGEFELLWGEDIGFQKNSKLMMSRLDEVLHSQNKDILVGLPNIFGDMSDLAPSTIKWWNEYRLVNFTKIKDSLGGIENAVDTNITRFTTERPAGEAEKFITLFRKIWNNRDVTIVEGDKSRLGVGNDLFDNVASLTRIIAPAKNAFLIYDELLQTCIKEIPKGNVVIIALGPTATVLAYDLALAGYQALDLGHIDIQYEYYLRGIYEKVPIPGKYVNEGGAIGQTPDDSIIDQSYLKSIKVNLANQ